MKYSVIIPVYNCACYLESCVESVLQQKTDAEYEMILVDDGSTDGSSQLCDSIAEKYACVRVIHQTNQGVSAARNTGISAARGEYILFLDGDDLWREDLLQCMDVAAESHPDVVQFGFRTFFEDGKTEDCLPHPAIDGETGRDYMVRVLNQGSIPIGSCCIHAHRRAFLVQNGLRFSVNVTYGEDLLFRIRELEKAQRICGVNEPLYLYRRNSASATYNVSLKKMQDIIEVLEEFYRQFPESAVADHYCMQLVSMADLNRQEARCLLPMITQNRNILSAVRGKKSRIARAFYKLFGFYNGAKLIRLLIEIKNR